MAKYKNVKRLYFDGKSQIERLTGQVEQLQNAVANQRLSQSRTSWDDGEYTTRFNRLNGAINNLAFNIRKDWSTLPAWLDKYVSADALKTGKQEMTAVGRAVISHWIVDDFFNTCFHPGLDPHLSSLLKEMELSLRDQSHLMQSQEELDALTTKVVNWRMATLDGLQKKLASSAAADNHANLINKTTESLTAYLHQHLSKPPPPGVEGSTLMIIELAVAIATNLPLESRDVVIMYPRPGDIVQPDLMEVDKTGLPAPGAQKTDGEGPDGDEVEVEMPQEKDRNGKERSEDAKSGTLHIGPSVTAGRERQVTNERAASASVDDVGRVRFAGFMALEVKGRQILIKAPVWTL